MLWEQSKTQWKTSILEVDFANRIFLLQNDDRVVAVCVLNPLSLTLTLPCTQQNIERITVETIFYLRIYLNKGGRIKSKKDLMAIFKIVLYA